MKTADMMIYVHPDLDATKRMDLEWSLAVRIGVDCAEFEHRPHPHSLMVKYDPDSIKGTIGVGFAIVFRTQIDKGRLHRSTASNQFRSAIHPQLTQI